jgi:hypothetical protein
MAETNYYDIYLVSPEDPEYGAFMRRMADKRPSRGGPRAAGEYLGGLVERAVRHWLGKHVPLKEERILTWEQRLRNGRFGRLYREIDALWQIDPESLCLYEIKFTYPENMQKGVGLNQMDASAEVLYASKQYQYILKRLIYIAEEPVQVLEENLPALPPEEEYEELGVIWVRPEIVAQSARELEIDLPENWMTPEAREGYVEDPEREAWRQFADTETRSEEDSPLAQALQRALQQKSE